MFEEQLARAHKGQTGGKQLLPLFYRRRTGANGESDEISLGPSAVCIFRWVVALIITAALVLGGATPSVLMRFLLRILP